MDKTEFPTRVIAFYTKTLIGFSIKSKLEIYKYKKKNYRLIDMSFFGDKKIGYSTTLVFAKEM